MKARHIHYSLYLFVITLILCGLSCSKEDLDNPVASDTVLLPPSEVQITSFTDTSLTFTWKDVNKNIPAGVKKSIRVDYSTDGSTFSLLGEKEAVAGEATTFTRDFEANRQYSFRVYLLYDNKASQSFVKATGTNILNAPTNVQIQSYLADTAVVLSWIGNSPNESKFYIELGEDTLHYVLVDSAEANTITKRVAYNFAVNKNYVFRVRAKAIKNYSPYTPAVTARISLDAPSGLTVSLPSDTAAIITWTDNSTMESGFEIERSTNNTTFSKVFTATGNITTASVAGTYYLDSTYYFRVRAITPKNASLYSQTASKALTFPAPSNVSVSFVADTSATVTWQDNSTWESGFEIEQSSDNINFIKVRTVNANVTSANINGTYFLNAMYYFRVRGITSKYVSSYSSVVSNALEFPAPSNLTIQSLSATEAVLQWQDNSNLETGFIIEQSSDGANFSEVKNVPANSATANISGVYILDGPIYYFRVKAKSKNNETPNSNIASKQYSSVPDGFANVQGGTFTMGDTWGDGGSEEKPTHQVAVSSFYIGKYEVTQKRWKDAMGSSNNPSYFRGDTLPVEKVSWYDAIDYCNKLSVKEDKTPCYSINGNTNPIDWTNGTVDCNWSAKGYRLPTEAEWEYTARGGNKSAQTKYSGSANIDEVAWYGTNSNSQTHIVGGKKANELGVYDMSGNVYEWCWDWYGSYSSPAQTNPVGPVSGSFRVLRGGSWTNYISSYIYCRVPYRYGGNPDFTYDNFGFRVVLAK